MPFETTSLLLETLKPCLGTAVVSITAEAGDSRDPDTLSDLVWIDVKNNVGVQVFRQAILVFYFTDHAHFEDVFDPDEGEAPYFQRAADFLKNLLQYPIRHVETYKGTVLASERYWIAYPDERSAECIGNTWFGLSHGIHPFSKKSVRSTVWQFDPAQGVFTAQEK